MGLWGEEEAKIVPQKWNRRSRKNKMLSGGLPQRSSSSGPAFQCGGCGAISCWGTKSPCTRSNWAWAPQLKSPCAATETQRRQVCNGPHCHLPVPCRLDTKRPGGHSPNPVGRQGTFRTASSEGTAHCPGSCLLPPQAALWRNWLLLLLLGSLYKLS